MSPQGGEFQEFFEAEFPRLYRLAYLLSGNPMEAEDLAQEAMVRTFGAWRRIREREHPASYSRTVLVNRWRSILRRRRVGTAHSLPMASISGEPNDERFGLWQGVLRLPAPQRAAIVLRYYEDRTEAETAAILNCPIGTVKSHVRRGLARLRDSFGDENEAAPATEREK